MGDVANGLDAHGHALPGTLPVDREAQRGHGAEGDEKPQRDGSQKGEEKYQTVLPEMGQKVNVDIVEQLRCNGG